MENPNRQLSELFNWENRERNYRVRFLDGKQCELRDVYAGQDLGERPHATAEIVRTQHPMEELPVGRAIFFYLSEVAVVTDLETETVLYEADRI
jgi:hypothetical protein